MAKNKSNDTKESIEESIAIFDNDLENTFKNREFENQIKQ